MENASEALRMAAAVLIFAGALTIAILSFTKAREASASIMAQAEKNRTYYNVENPISERTVGVDIVISNMYSYYQTQNTIVFFKGSLDSNGELSDDTIEKMPLYETQVIDDNKLRSSSLTVSEGSKEICGLDIKDENIREEPWTSSVDRTKKFIDYLVTQTIPNDITFNYRIERWLYNLNGGSFINAQKAKFIERIGEYNSDLESAELYPEGDDGATGEFKNLTVESSITRFEGTNETIDNSRGDKERVIEYIYIY